MGHTWSQKILCCTAVETETYDNATCTCCTFNLNRGDDIDAKNPGTCCDTKIWCHAVGRRMWD
jgi:hypothetical protein